MLLWRPFTEGVAVRENEWMTTDDVGHCEDRGWWRGFPVGIVAGILGGVLLAFGWSHAVPDRGLTGDGNNANAVPVQVNPNLVPMPIDPKFQGTR